MKKIKHFLIFFTLLGVLLCSYALTPKKVTVQGSDDFEKTLYVTSQNSVQMVDGKPYYIPNDVNKIVLNISVVFPSNDDSSVMVHYKTRDFSAILDEHDYFGVDETITLTAKNPSYKVTLTTHKESYRMGKNYNAFQFLIDEVTTSDNSNVIVSESSKITYCAIDAYKVFETKINATNGKEMLAEFDNYYQIPVPTVTDKDNESIWKVYEASYTRYVDSQSLFDLQRNYVDYGLGDVYLGGHISVDAKHTWDWDDDEMEIDVYNGSNLHFYKIGLDNRMFDYDTVYFGSSGSSSSYYGGSSAISSTGRNCSNYVKVPYAGTTDYYKWVFQCADVCKIEWYNPYFENRLIDITAPKITYWSIADKNVTIEDDLMVCVRFSEPVLVEGTPYLTCSLQPLFGVGVDESKKFSMKYVGGSGTNTLVFSCPCKDLATDSTKNFSVSQIYPCALTGDKAKTYAAKICDFGSNAKCDANYIAFYNDVLSSTSSFVNQDPKTLGCELKIDLDLRQPTVAVPASDAYFSTGAKKTHTGKVQISLAAKDAHIYYKWSESKFPFNLNNKTMAEAAKMYDVEVLNEDANSYGDRILYFEPENLNGAYYLHIMVMSKFGRKTQDLVVGTKDGDAVLFDNTPPTYVINPDSVLVPFDQKTIKLNITDYPNTAASGINYVNIIYTSNYDSYLNLVTNGVMDENIIRRRVYSESFSKMTYDDVNDIYEIILSADDEIIDLPENEHGTYYIAFQVEDIAGNVEDIKDLKFEKYKFDRREHFATNFANAEGTTNVISVPTDSIYAYDSSKQNQFIVSKEKPEEGVLQIAEVLHNGVEITADEFCTFTSDDDKITVTTKENLIGVYEVIFQYNTKVSDVYTFYFSNTFDKATHNSTIVDNSGIFINYFYRLNSSNYFYKDADEKVITADYGNTKYLPSFSSKSVAKKFVEYMEKQDFQLYQVPTQAWADSLNAGTLAERTLALNESHVAKPGDYYIRYKKADWLFGDTTSSSWVYYFYSETLTEINEADLSQNLKNALANVVNTILSNGGEHFIADEELDAHGSPYLREGQYYYDNLSTIKSFTNSPFKNTIEFKGDKDIYSSYITYDNSEYRLLGTYEFDFEQYTRVFYRRLGVSGAEFKELPVFTPYLKGVISKEENDVSDGVYEILEIDENGMSIKEYFMDFNAPQIRVSSEVNQGSEEIPALLDSSFNGKTYSAKVFFVNEMLEENDLDFAYIAVYRITAVSTSLYRVIRAQDCGTELASVERGNYLVKMYDRSGNNFTLNIRVNDTPLIVNIIPNHNYNIRIECNRLDTDIQTFQIYRDGQLLTTEYKPSYVFRENGEYRVFVQDWYGNTFDETRELTRTLPDIAWRYEKGSTVFRYDGTKEQKGITLYSVGTQEYDLYTNGDLTLIYPIGSEYSYEFLNYDPTKGTPKATEITTNEKQIKIDCNHENYSVKVYYTDFPDVFVMYNIIYDNDVPYVDVVTNEFEYIDDELTEIEEFINAFSKNPSILDPELNGKRFVPSSIKYTIDNEDSLAHYIADKAVIVSNLIKVSFRDESYVTNCTVELDGKKILELNDEYGVKPFTLSQFGHYVITASDALGNTAYFEFTNSQSKQAYIEADGEVIDEDDKLLGNENFTFNVLEEGIITFLVKKGDETYFYMFTIGKESQSDKSLDNEKVIVTRNDFIYDSNSQGGIKIVDELIYEPGAINVYEFGKNDNLDFTFKFNNGVYQFILKGNDVDEYKVYAKYSNEKSEPFYIEGILSNKKSEAKIESNNTIYTTKDQEVVNINGEFHFVDPTFDDEIVKIVLKNLQNNTEDLIYSLEDGFNDLVYSENGTYEVTITNIYGKVSVSEIRISTIFEVLKNVQLLNGAKFSYSSDYEEIIYSNKQVELILLTSTPNVLCFKDGNEYRFDLIKGNNQSTIILDTEGSYHLEVTDEYGNFKEIEIRILSKQTTFNEKLLTNYNEKALLKDQGYTNQILKVDQSVILNNEIAYVSYVFNNVEEVLYDQFSETKLDFDEENALVGTNGTGIYTVKVLDIYGNEATKTIHYRAESSFSISRTIRSNGQFEDYDLAFAIENGCYSNNSIRFQTSSNNYNFTIDGKTSELEKTLSFAQGVDKGSLDYDIYYVDEYGFEYSFKAHLYRVEVVIYADNLEDFVEVDNILTTRKNFTVSFSSDAMCSYVLNDITYEYHKGDVLKRDGIYRFTVTDYAGNIATVTYRKDSICEYTFVDTIGAKTLVSGDVANNERVVFRPVNSDIVYLSEVYLNGEKIENYKDDKFSENGHWEILVKDEIGNTSYFEFYILSHQIKGFTYETPYTYKIQSITYTTEYGGVVSVLGYVTQNDDTSSFSFGTVSDSIKKSEDGYYEVVMYSTIYGEYSTFNFTISNVEPNIRLVSEPSGGKKEIIAEGEETIKTVTIEGYSVGDTIKVYKDNKLVKTTKVTSTSFTPPLISDGGHYVIEVTNEAGLSQTLEFTRTYVFNVAGSSLIIISAIALNILLFIGLVYRTKSKIDK